MQKQEQITANKINEGRESLIPSIRLDGQSSGVAPVLSKNVESAEHIPADTEFSLHSSALHQRRLSLHPGIRGLQVSSPDPDPLLPPSSHNTPPTNHDPAPINFASPDGKFHTYTSNKMPPEGTEPYTAPPVLFSSLTLALPLIRLFQSMKYSLLQTKRHQIHCALCICFSQSLSNVVGTMYGAVNVTGIPPKLFSFSR